MGNVGRTGRRVGQGPIGVVTDAADREVVQLESELDRIEQSLTVGLRIVEIYALAVSLEAEVRVQGQLALWVN